MIYKILKRYFPLVLVLLITTSSIAFAEDGKHKIDIELDACISEASSLSERLECYSIANDKWDRKLEAVYNLLMNKLDGQVYLGLMKEYPEALVLEKKFNQKDQDQRVLKESQLSWLAYREKQKELQGIMLGVTDGVLGRNDISAKNGFILSITRSRACELKSLLDFINDIGPHQRFSLRTFSMRGFTNLNSYSQIESRYKNWEPGITYLPGKFLLTYNDGFDLKIGNKIIKLHRFNENNAETSVSPDKKAVFINYRTGAFGTYELAVNSLQAKFKKYDVTRYIKRDVVSQYPDCFNDESPYVAGIEWLRGSSRLLVIAQVPETSNCGYRGTFSAYEVSVSSGKIIKKWNQSDTKKRFTSWLGRSLINADDKCFLNGDACRSY